MKIPEDKDSKLEYLKDAIQEGITDLKTGKVNDGNIVMDRLRERLISQGAGQSYELPQESLALLEMLAQSSQNIQEGKIKPVKRAFADIRKRFQDPI